MNQLTDYILQPEVELYRYDIQLPPQEWDVDFKNPEYAHYTMGPKNQIGAFFFFNSFEQAEKTASRAVTQNKDMSSEFWITKCKRNMDLRLLDLRDFLHCTGLLATLDHNGFNVLTDDFKTWHGIPFSAIASNIKQIEAISKDPNWYLDKAKSEIVNLAVTKVEDTFLFLNDNIGALCQLLTDFSNGFSFKSQLQENGYEGYIFNESDHSEGSDTLCILDCNKFYPPIKCNYRNPI